MDFRKGICGYEASISQMTRQKTSLKSRQFILSRLLVTLHIKSDGISDISE